MRSMISIHALDTPHVLRHLARRAQNVAEAKWEHNLESLVIEASSSANLWRGLADELRLATARGALRVRRSGNDVVVSRGDARVICRPCTDGVYRSANSIVEVRRG